VFVAGDVGKRIVITGAASTHNDRAYTIATYVNPTTVTLEETPPTVPDGNNGSLTWVISHYQFEVTSTTPPTVGAATIEYICPKAINCRYCPSHRMLVEATTGTFMEDPFTRIDERLEQVTPKHVDRVYAFGFEVTASLTLGAVIVTP
jgi:hypothetical protein